MPKRKNFSCMLRRFDKYPNGEVMRVSNDQIMISYYKDGEISPSKIICSQRDARLIAKRINQFLDGGG